MLHSLEGRIAFVGALCWGSFSICVHVCFGQHSKSAGKMRLLDAAGNVLFGQGMRLLPYCLDVVT